MLWCAGELFIFSIISFRNCLLCPVDRFRQLSRIISKQRFILPNFFSNVVPIFLPSYSCSNFPLKLLLFQVFPPSYSCSLKLQINSPCSCLSVLCSTTDCGYNFTHTWEISLKAVIASYKCALWLSQSVKVNHGTRSFNKNGIKNV